MERIWTDVFVDSQCKRSINTKIIQGLGKLLSYEDSTALP